MLFYSRIIILTMSRGFFGGFYQCSPIVKPFFGISYQNNAELKIASGADVNIYVTGDIEIKNSGDLNSGGDPADLMFLTQGNIVLKNSGEIYGIFYGPEGDADLR